MSHYWTPTEFAEYLNTYVKVQPPDVVELKKDKDKHEGGLFPTETLRLRTIIISTSSLKAPVRTSSNSTVIFRSANASWQKARRTSRGFMW